MSGRRVRDPSLEVSIDLVRWKFKATLPLIFAPAHQNQGNLVITGKFGPHGSVTGTVTTAFRTARVCNGSSKCNAHG